jgi:Neuraminidase (sialidase)
MCALSDGTLLCAFDVREHHANSVIKIVKSSDGGLNWEEWSVIDYYAGLNCANPGMIELENGEIWLSHRANARPRGEHYTSLQNNISRDGGKTWERHSVIDEQYGIGGVYEPHFGRIGGKIAVFYANDSRNAVTAHMEQNIEFKTWESGKWSAKQIASDGTKTHSRDGMPVWDRRTDDRYALVIEATNVAGFPFVLQMKSSPDGYDWSEALRTVYVPHREGRKAAAPYVATLPDGRLLVSFQTDEDATEAGDRFSVMKVMVSTDETGDTWHEPFMPFNIPDGYCAIWNGLYVYNGRVYAVTSANYPSNGIYLRRASLSKQAWKGAKHEC